MLASPFLISEFSQILRQKRAAWRALKRQVANLWRRKALPSSACVISPSRPHNTLKFSHYGGTIDFQSVKTFSATAFVGLSLRMEQAEASGLVCVRACLPVFVCVCVLLLIVFTATGLFFTVSTLCSRGRSLLPLFSDYCPRFNTYFALFCNIIQILCVGDSVCVCVCVFGVCLFFHREKYMNHKLFCCLPFPDLCEMHKSERKEQNFVESGFFSW